MSLPVYVIGQHFMYIMETKKTIPSIDPDGLCILAAISSMQTIWQLYAVPMPLSLKKLIKFVFNAAVPADILNHRFKLDLISTPQLLFYIITDLTSINMLNITIRQKISRLPYYLIS